MGTSTVQAYCPFAVDFWQIQVLNINILAISIYIIMNILGYKLDGKVNDAIAKHY